MTVPAGAQHGDYVVSYGWSEENGVRTRTGRYIDGNIAWWDTTTSVCPECVVKKCGNCNRQAWDDEVDEVAVCACWARGHRERESVGLP